VQQKQTYNLQQIADRIGQRIERRTGYDWAEPKIHIDWRRFKDHEFANFKRAIQHPYAYSIVGGRDEGKSSINETIASKYPHIIDLFGASDDEGLAWLRTKRSARALLLHGSTVEIKNSGWDTKTLKQFQISDVDRYDVIISPSSFYSDVSEEWATIALLMDILKKRKYGDLAAISIREAASLIYSRIAVGDKQGDAKNKMIYTLREMRHSLLALILDTLRTNAIDIDVRTLADYRIIKAVGVEGLGDELKFLYSMYDPESMMLMQKKDFVIVCRKGPIGDGTFDFPGWHKREGEDMLQLFDLKPRYTGSLALEDKRTVRVSAYAHANIINARFYGIPDPDDPNPDETQKKKTKSMGKIATALGHSSATVMHHINDHNAMIRDKQLCLSCTDAGRLDLHKQILC
jgi:hypothetical protein